MSIYNVEFVGSGAKFKSTGSFVGLSTTCSGNNNSAQFAFANDGVIIHFSDQRIRFTNLYFMNNTAAIGTINNNVVSAGLKVRIIGLSNKLGFRIAYLCQFTVLNADVHYTSTAWVDNDAD